MIFNYKKSLWEILKNIIIRTDTPAIIKDTKKETIGKLVIRTKMDSSK
jgi:hypothetical protein